MLAGQSGNDENFVEIFGGGDNEGDDFSMPLFEMSHSTVKPCAPPEEDYPVGCEVELRDVEYARELHNRGKWESTYELLFAMPRRSVTVCRHHGDYTFVVCRTVQGYEQVGATLYRACLGELKVRDANAFFEESIIRDGSGEAQDQPTSLTELLHRYTPPTMCAADEPVRDTPDTASAPRLGTVHRASHVKAVTCNDLDTPPRGILNTRSTAGTTAEDDGGRRTSTSNVQEVRNRRRFNETMSEGTAFFNQKQYEKAIECYTRAMSIESAERARALCSRSACYLMLDDHRAALDDAFDAIRADRNDFNGYVRAANVFSSARKFDKAHLYYLRAIKLRRDDRRICNLFVSNFASKLYSGPTSKLPFKIAYHHNCLQAIAKRTIPRDRAIMCEETALCCPLARWRGAGTYSSEFPMCSRCGKHLLRWKDVKAALPSLSQQVHHTICRPTDPVPCLANCGRFYCSEACRDKAWQLYHFFECPIRGKWRDGISKLDAFLIQAVHGEGEPAVTPAQKPLLSNTLLTAVESESAVTRVTCVRIAVRMLCTLESTTVTINDSAHRFDFMSVAPEVEKQREAVAPFLEQCYNLLAPNFVLLERDHLPLKFFVDCYERVKSNAIYVTTTPWKHISSEARNINNFISLTSNGDPDMPLGHPSFMQVDVKSEIGEILRMPEAGPTGLQSTWLCVFELTTPIMTHSERLYARGRGRRQPNVAVRTTVEPTLCVHLDSLCEIQAKEPLIVARLTRLECAN